MIELHTADWKEPAAGQVPMLRNPIQPGGISQAGLIKQQSGQRDRQP